MKEEAVSKERWYGWHFLPEDRKLRWNGDGSPVELGKIYRAEGDLVLCANGMHASARAMDALQYAPGPVVSWVELRGERLDDRDKSVARERIHLKMADATRALHLFAIGEARRAAASVTDERSWNALKVKCAWLYGKATDSDLDAAWTAAWTAANAAAWTAANAAAWTAAWDAANTRLESALRVIL